LHINTSPEVLVNKPGLLPVPLKKGITELPLPPKETDVNKSIISLLDDVVIAHLILLSEALLNELAKRL
jgi:hypothetical protein